MYCSTYCISTVPSFLYLYYDHVLPLVSQSRPGAWLAIKGPVTKNRFGPPSQISWLHLLEPKKKSFMFPHLNIMAHIIKVFQTPPSCYLFLFCERQKCQIFLLMRTLLFYFPTTWWYCNFKNVTKGPDGLSRARRTSRPI